MIPPWAERGSARNPHSATGSSRVTAQSDDSNRVRSERKQHHDSKDVPREPGFSGGCPARQPCRRRLFCQLHNRPWIISYSPAGCARPGFPTWSARTRWCASCATPFAPTAWPMPSCSPGRGAWARPAPRASSPRCGIASIRRMRSPATPAITAWRSRRTPRRTCTRLTRLPTGESTTSGSCGRTSSSHPPSAGTRPTSWTKSTCSPLSPSTPC